VVLVWWTGQRRAQGPGAGARGQSEIERERARWDANAIEAAGLRALLHRPQGEADAAEKADITRWNRLAAIRPLVVEAARRAGARARLAAALRSGR
jgi:hypothetical protein